MSPSIVLLLIVVLSVIVVAVCTITIALTTPKKGLSPSSSIATQPETKPPRQGLIGPITAIWHTNQLHARGTTWAVYDYAFEAQKRWGWTSYVTYIEGNVVPEIGRYFERVFPGRVIPLPNNDKMWEFTADLVSRVGAKLHYTLLSSNHPNNKLSVDSSVVQVRHCVFDGRALPGTVACRISGRVPLSDGATEETVPVIPHMVRHFADTGPNLRKELGIPTSATVFGTLCGPRCFGVPFVRDVLKRVVREHDNIWFVIATIEPFDEHPHIICLPPILSRERASHLIWTSDAMLHARDNGETFGLAVAEFSQHNRPVITTTMNNQAQLKLLGDKGIRYSSADELFRLLTTFDRKSAKGGDWRAYADYLPEPVMQRFISVVGPHLSPSGLPPRSGITTIIVTSPHLKMHARPSLVERNLAALKEHVPELLHHVIVVCDGNANNTEERLDSRCRDGFDDAFFGRFVEELKRVESRWPSVELVVLPQRSCLTGAVTEGLRRTKTPFVAVLQHDMVFQSGVDINASRSFIESHQDGDVVVFTPHNFGEYPEKHYAVHAPRHTGIPDAKLPPPLVRTHAGKIFTQSHLWTDNNHLTTKHYYETHVLPHVSLNGFMESTMEKRTFRSRVGQLPPEGFGVWFYGAAGDTPVTRHLDGRAK